MQRVIVLIVAISASAAFSQTSTSQKPPGEKTEATATAATATDIAKAAVAAHGGEKFKQMKSLLVAGSVDIAGSPTTVIQGTFRIIISGEKYMLEIANPMAPFKQAFDGRQTSSSGYELPPLTSIGFPLLTRVGDTGYVIAEVPDAKRKKKGFRVTTPDGFYTDFTVDEKTGQIKGFESSYNDINGQLVTTSVVIDEYQTVEGITVPKKYSQRFDMGKQMTVYANFNTKQIQVNTPIADDVFTLAK